MTVFCNAYFLLDSFQVVMKMVWDNAYRREGYWDNIYIFIRTNLFIIIISYICFSLSPLP